MHILCVGGFLQIVTPIAKIFVRASHVPLGGKHTYLTNNSLACTSVNDPLILS
jgi:hypothetical protein